MLDDCMYVHFSPQLEKSRTFSNTSTSVSINSTAGRPSGWAVPRILVLNVELYVYFSETVVLCVCMLQIYKRQDLLNLLIYGSDGCLQICMHNRELPAGDGLVMSIRDG